MKPGSALMMAKTEKAKDVEFVGGALPVVPKFSAEKPPVPACTPASPKASPMKVADASMTPAEKQKAPAATPQSTPIRSPNFKKLRMASPKAPTFDDEATGQAGFRFWW